jgi:hypothetical protein
MICGMAVRPPHGKYANRRGVRHSRQARYSHARCLAASDSAVRWLETLLEAGRMSRGRGCSGDSRGC